MFIAYAERSVASTITSRFRTRDFDISILAGQKICSFCALLFSYKVIQRND